MLRIEFFRQGEKLVDIGEANTGDVDETRLDRHQLDLGPQDQPGQSKAADGRSKKGFVEFRRTFQLRTVAACKAEAAHVPAERAADMMIFSVNIVCNSATERRVLGAWGDRQHPAARNRDLKYLFQRDAWLRA